jgi:serine/threonine protein kinase
VPGYELRQLIGAGQLGEVHRAYQPSVGREVALRIFGRAMVCHPQFVRRFETESQRITRVEHPHVVPLLDYWREPNRAVMVTRLLTGGTLVDRIPSDGFGTAQTLELVETIASALASAHRHGVVHGRVRPENVLFDAEGNAFVSDLGIDQICSGVITFASSAYDAPERLGGALATPASDVYSLGVLVQHLLSGCPPPLDRALDVVDGTVPYSSDYEAEMEILRWIYLGKSNFEIGVILSISPLTVGREKCRKNSLDEIDFKDLSSPRCSNFENLRQPDEVPQELKPEIEHSAHSVAYQMLSVSRQEAQSDVMGNLRPHLVLHGADGFFGRRIEQRGRIHLV